MNNDTLRKLRSIGISLVRYDRLLQSTQMFLEVRKKTLQICDKCNINSCNKACEYKIVIKELEYFNNRIKQLEEIGKALLYELPVWTEWLQYIKGASAKYFVRMLGFLDFNKPHPSNWWSFAGLTPDSNKTGKYNHILKGVLYKFGMALLGWNKIYTTAKPRFDGAYARYFLQEREKAKQKHPDWNNLHITLHAMRKMLKLFLSHLFIVYHWLEHKIAVVHYAVAHLHHDYIYMPPIDKLVEPPRWWKELYNEYLKMKIRPVIL